jgi:hypothetical protein
MRLTRVIAVTAATGALALTGPASALAWGGEDDWGGWGHEWHGCSFRHGHDWDRWDRDRHCFKHHRFHHRFHHHHWGWGDEEDD